MYMMYYYFTIQHELVHKTIFKDYGIDSRIVIDAKLKGYTISQPHNLSKEHKQNMILQHNINEAIGYQLEPILLLLSIITFCVVIITADKLK